ncbi:WD40/YVTN/BNR-like repeat-containing protein, partial [Candidatus Omnitrophota bacterium]
TTLGDILCVEMADNIDQIYAGSEKGFFRSVDGGISWKKVDVSGNSVSIKRIALAGNNIYLATPQGVYAGDLASDTWRRIPGKKKIEGVVVSPQQDLWVWSEKELFRVKDDAWESITRGIPWRIIDDVVYCDGILFVASGGDIYRSADDGRSWGKISIMQNYDDREEVIMEEKEEKFVRTKRMDMCGMDSVAVATERGVYILRKDGSILKRIDTTGLPSVRVRDVACAGGKVFAITDRKAFLYKEEGRTWTPAFKLTLPGSINFARGYAGTQGHVRLLVAAGKFLYMGDIDLSGDENERSKGGSEPSVLDVQRMAVEYAEVSPEKIKRWRKGAMWKAVLPRLSLNISESYDDNVEIYKNSTTSYVISGPRERDNDWGIDLTWDLSDLIWNDAQTSIDVRSKLMVQLREEILEEVTRLYFERKRLATEIREADKEESVKGGPLSEKDLKIQELTAYIDALTGGGFTEALHEN